MMFPILATVALLALSIPAWAQSPAGPPAGTETPAPPAPAPTRAESNATPELKPAPEPPPAPPVREWYGNQILLSSGISHALMVGGLFMFDHPGIEFVSIGAAGYVLGGPIAHWRHGNIGTGFASLGLNLALPMVTGVAGAGIMCSGDRCSGEMGGLGVMIGFFLGIPFGTIAATIIDASYLAYTDPKDAKPAPEGAFVWPEIKLTPDGATFGLAGTF